MIPETTKSTGSGNNPNKASAIIIFSVLMDLFVFFIPEQGITDDLVLNCLYGGILYGIGLGLVYRGKGTSGGSDILGMILYHWMGIPLSYAYLVTDGIIVLGGGFAFGWKYALYGLVVIYVSGLAAETISEGSAIFRTTLIITNRPEEVAQEIYDILGRGATILPGMGA